MSDSFMAHMELFRPVEVKTTDFKFLSSIGSGGNGDVFQALHIQTGVVCAVKQLKSQTLSKSEEHAFYREAKVMVKCQNFFLIPLWGISLESPYIIAMKHIKKGSLRAAILHQEGAPILTPTNKTIIAFCIASGMQYLHDRKIIHRDLKTLNVLLDGKLYPHICDFGLSRVKSDEAQLMTQNIGTPAWMAPEVYTESNYTNKVDVYSYGILLWELLTDQKAFKNYTPVQHLSAVVKGHERPKIPSRCPDKLKNLINQCWHHDPNIRPTFNEVMDVIRNGKAYFPDTDVDEMQKFFELYDSDYFSKKGKKPSPLLKRITKAQKEELEIKKKVIQDHKEGEDGIPSFSVTETYPKKLQSKSKSVKSIKKQSNNLFKNTFSTMNDIPEYSLPPPSDIVDNEEFGDHVEEIGDSDDEDNFVSKKLRTNQEDDDLNLQRLVSLGTVKKLPKFSLSSMIAPAVFVDSASERPSESEIPISPVVESLKPKYLLGDPNDYVYEKKDIPKPSVFVDPKPPEYDENGNMKNIFLEMESPKILGFRSIYGSTNVDILLDYTLPTFQNTFLKTMWGLNEKNAKDFFSAVSLLFSPPIPLHICKTTMSNVLRCVENNQTAWKPFGRSQAPDNLPIQTPFLFSLSARLILYTIPMNPGFMTIERCEQILSMAKYKVHQVLRIFSVYVANLNFMADPFPILERFLDQSLIFIEKKCEIEYLRIIYHLLTNNVVFAEKFSQKCSDIALQCLYTTDLNVVNTVYSLLINTKLKINIPIDILLVHIKYQGSRSCCLSFITKCENFAVQDALIDQIISFGSKCEIAALLLSKLASSTSAAQMIAKNNSWMEESFCSTENCVRIFCAIFIREQNRDVLINNPHFPFFMVRLLSSTDNRFIGFCNTIISVAQLYNEVIDKLRKKKFLEKYIEMALSLTTNEQHKVGFLTNCRKIIAFGFFDEYKELINKYSVFFVGGNENLIKPALELLVDMVKIPEYFAIVKHIDLIDIVSHEISDYCQQIRDFVIDKIVT